LSFPRWSEGANLSLCTNLDREQFSSQLSSHFLRRTRSASNPTQRSQPPQPAHYAVNLARYSPSSHPPPHAPVGPSAAFFKYYTIRPCVNCRLSSSEPNLATRLSAAHLF
jgi:hypothetical protein